MTQKFFLIASRLVTVTLILASLLSVILYFHNPDVPLTPSSQEKQMVSNITSKNVALTLKCVSAMESFISNPYLEQNLGEKVVFAHEDWYRFHCECQRNPIYYIGLSECDAKRSAEIIEKLDKTTMKFIVELNSRIDDPKFNADESTYQKIGAQLGKEFLGDRFCCPSKCLMCRCKLAFQNAIFGN